MNDEYFNAIKEILDYVEEQEPGISYLDVKAYAFNNDLEHWIKAFRYSRSRSIISSYLREKRKLDGVPYTNDVRTSSQLFEEAVSNYCNRHNLERWQV